MDPASFVLEIIAVGHYSRCEVINHHWYAHLSKESLRGLCYARNIVTDLSHIQPTTSKLCFYHPFIIYRPLTTESLKRRKAIPSLNRATQFRRPTRSIDFTGRIFPDAASTNLLLACYQRRTNSETQRRCRTDRWHDCSRRSSCGMNRQGTNTVALVYSRYLNQRDSYT